MVLVKFCLLRNMLGRKINKEREWGEFLELLPLVS